MVAPVSSQPCTNQDTEETEILSDEEISSIKKMLEEAHRAHQVLDASLAEWSTRWNRLEQNFQETVKEYLLESESESDSESESSVEASIGIPSYGIPSYIGPLTLSETENMDKFLTESTSGSELDLNIAAAATGLHQSVLNMSSPLDNTLHIVEEILEMRIKAIGNSRIQDLAIQDPRPSSPISVMQIKIYENYLDRK